MPSVLALALVAGFVYFLLKLDHRQWPEASPNLWIPTIWLMVATTKALGTWLGRPSANFEEGSSIDRNFLLLLMGLAIVTLVKRKARIRGFLLENRWLVVLFAFMLVSISWSPVPFVSLKRWLREAIGVVMALAILTEENPKLALEAVIRRAVYILIPVSLLLIKYFPHLGVFYNVWTGARMWIGVTDEKNEFGQLTCFAAFFLIWSLWKGRQSSPPPRFRQLTVANLAVLAIALFMTRGSKAGYSATSIVMLAVALMCFAGLLWLRRIGKVLPPSIISAFFALLILFGTLTPLLGRLPAGDITSAIGRNSTLTDRTLNWAILVPQALSRPALGHGIGGFWTNEAYSRYVFPAHNGYLEVLLVLGFVGLIFMSIYLISSARKAQYLLSRDFNLGVLWICWLLMALLNNVAESSLHSFSNLLMSIPLWLSIIYGCLARSATLPAIVAKTDEKLVAA